MSAELDEPVDAEVDGGLGRSTSICPVDALSRYILILILMLNLELPQVMLPRS